MAVPRNRTSNSKKNHRRSHHAKKPKNLAACTQCGVRRMPHCICPSCGAYGNRIVIEGKEEAGE